MVLEGVKWAIESLEDAVVRMKWNQPNQGFAIYSAVRTSDEENDPRKPYNLLVWTD